MWMRLSGSTMRLPNKENKALRLANILFSAQEVKYSQLNSSATMRASGATHFSFN